MNSTTGSGPQAILGGTFNPIHFGHLRCAIELTEQLGLEQTRLMPSAQPPHRAQPSCSASHRAAMVELAVAEESLLRCDQRELKRSGPSYTIDSLCELRKELGPDVSLSLAMGLDALHGLASWHCWESLLDHAHIVVMTRPGWALPAQGQVAEWLDRHKTNRRDAITELPNGNVWLQELRPLPISSTEIRSLLQSGQSARYLLPESVLDYIQSNELYV
ncbi:MAG: nicotinate-nucleotide adenylyltransferase [Halioglobus sp.]